MVNSAFALVVALVASISFMTEASAMGKKPRHEDAQIPTSVELNRLCRRVAVDAALERAAKDVRCTAQVFEVQHLVNGGAGTGNGSRDEDNSDEWTSFAPSSNSDGDESEGTVNGASSDPFMARFSVLLGCDSDFQFSYDVTTRLTNQRKCVATHVTYGE